MFSGNTINIPYQVTVPSGANFLNTTTRTRLPATGSLGYDPSLNVLYYGSNDLWYQIDACAQGPTGPYRAFWNRPYRPFRN